MRVCTVDGMMMMPEPEPEPDGVLSFGRGTGARSCVPRELRVGEGV